MKLVDYLNQHNWSPEKLALAMDYTKFHITNVLRGKSNMCNKFRKKLSALIIRRDFSDCTLREVKKEKKSV